ncbi:MAG: hypothetical protein HY901_12475, partial [Deltaproteobacteria bacterium]|nr:hypothetical protein [Deltaproteobacteria bacterium]
MSFYFVFAGHGDVADGRGFVELSDGPFTSDDLDVLLARVGARESHVILDSCNSFFVISPRKPGGRRFATPSDAAESLARRHPGVGVFLSTSAEAQVYEWSELQSGIFSHAVRSGLAGAADADGDSRVSYQELAAFVDIAAAGIRNPGYRPKVFARGPAGDGNRTLVDLNARNLAVLAIDDPGAVRLRVRDTDGLRWVDLYKEEGASIELRLPHPLAQRMEVERLRLIGKEASVEARYRAPLLPA